MQQFNFKIRCGEYADSLPHGLGENTIKTGTPDVAAINNACCHLRPSYSSPLHG